MYLPKSGDWTTISWIRTRINHSNFGFCWATDSLFSNTRYVYYKPQIIITRQPRQPASHSQILATLAVRIRVVSVFAGRLRLPELSVAAMKRNTGGCVCDMDSLGIWRERCVQICPIYDLFYMYLKSIQTRRKKSEVGGQWSTNWVTAAGL